MLSNQFRTDPIHLVVWSRDKTWTASRCVFMGQQPQDIKTQLDAALARTGRGLAVPHNTTLHKYFGENWRTKIGLLSEKKGDKKKGDKKKGGDAGEPVELERDAVEITDSENDGAAPSEMLQDLAISLDDFTTTRVEKTVTSGLQYLYDVDIYPEDKVSEFKLKICKAFQIPVFRQHCWYRTSSQSFPLRYNFLQAGSSSQVDMNGVISEGDTNESIYGMPINMFLYRNKDTIKIEAYDNFTLLGNIYNRSGVVEYNLVDLETFVAPHRQELSLISKDDKYQLQMLFFGFVIKYWPQMNVAAFVEYLDERSITSSYPQLDPAADDLLYLAKQQVVMRELYTLYEGDMNRVNRIDDILLKSLTETTLKVGTSHKGKMLNLRVLFDIYQLTEKVDQMSLYDQIDGRPIRLNKYVPGGRASEEILLPGVLYFRVIVSLQPRQYLNLFIYPNCAYSIKGTWGEDQNYEFSDVNLIVDKHINPIIAEVNRFASQIMYHGEGSHIDPVEKGNVKFVDISISLFWKKILTSGEFRQLKTVLDQFVAARIIQDKQIDGNTISYFFKRGMYEFDPHRIEKTAQVDNYYAYLYNSDVRQKWFMLFENIRVLTVTHRFSDVKIEISGIKEDEYYIFIRYIVLLMSQFMRERGVNAPREEERKITKPLSNLKEQDPHLYNFKKHYDSELVYSKLCQKPYQPHLLTQGQYDRLDRTAKDSTTKYWNFTTSTDAYYQCPNPKFPHVRFIVGKHPKGYCIPCCKITAPPRNPADKQRVIYDRCIREHTFAPREVERSTSRYIMSYGKPIDIGRLSHLPETSLEPLFYETKPDEPGQSDDDNDVIGSKYYLYGVPQNHPRSRNCGLLYSYSHAMGVNLEALADTMATRIDKNPANFQMLLGGGITQWFRTAAELTRAIRSTFIAEQVETDPFPHWNALMQDIALQFLEIYTVVFEDRDTVIQLRLPEYLDNIDDIKYPDHSHLIMLHNLATDYWNPIYILHKDLYFRAGIIDRKLFSFQSDIVQLIMEMIRNKSRSEHAHRLTYDVLRQFVTQSSRYEIERLFVTRDNLCYGCHVSGVGYVPVHLSHFKFQEQLDICFKSSRIEAAAPAKLMAFISRYNNWVARQSELGGFIRIDVAITRPLIERVEPIYPLIVIDRWLVHHGRVICGSGNNMHFYIEPVAIAAAQRLSRNALLQHVSYDPRDVNTILESHNQVASPALPDPRTERVDHALYHNYLYQLLVLEFIQLFNMQRNLRIRDQFKRLILRTDFKQPIGTLVSEIQKIVLQGFDRNVMLQADVEKMKMQVVEWLISGDPKKRLLQIFDSEYYSFDMIMVERLKRLPRQQIHDQLHKLARQFVEIGQVDRKNFKFPNILASCDKQTAGPAYCRRGRLVISRADLDRYIDILADQMKNPFVEKYLFSPLFQTSLIDYFSFTKRKNEIIEIEFL